MYASLGSSLASDGSTYAMIAGQCENSVGTVM
jgi:hypothetical protein